MKIVYILFLLLFFGGCLASEGEVNRTIARAEMGIAKAQTPILPGGEEITASVSVTFAFRD
jgi:hypothetical protein